MWADKIEDAEYLSELLVSNSPNTVGRGGIYFIENTYPAFCFNVGKEYTDMLKVGKTWKRIPPIERVILKDYLREPETLGFVPTFLSFFCNQAKIEYIPEEWHGSAGYCYGLSTEHPEYTRLFTFRCENSDNGEDVARVFRRLVTNIKSGLKLEGLVFDKVESSE